MRASSWLIIAACAALPVTAAAQTQTTTTTQTTTDVDYDAIADDQWIASGFAGTNFGQDVDDPRLDFGGTVGYLWNGNVGVEFQANFSPGFHVEGGRSLLFADEPAVNSYMLNVMGAGRLGSEGQWQPYVSGGFGALTLRSEELDFDDLEPNGQRWGTNIGGGVMGYGSNNIGFRGDLRLFHGFGNDEGSAEEDFTVGDEFLSGLTLWRATAGVAFRW